MLRQGVRLFVYLACLSAGVFGSVQAADAYCLKGPLETPNGQSWETLRRIPVYLFAGPTDTVWNGMPIGEVEANIKAAVDTYWQEGQADVRPYWAGRTTSTSPSGRVVIREFNNCGTACRAGVLACAITYMATGHRAGSTLWFPTSPTCVPTWQSDPIRGSWGGVLSPFRKILTHELGHALGLLHPNDAKNPDCPWGGSYDADIDWAIMSIDSFYIDHTVRFDDRQGLVAMYGPLDRRLEAWRSDDMVSWAAAGVRTRTSPSRPTSGGWGFLDQNLLGLPDMVLARASVDTFGPGVTDYWPHPSWPDGFTWQPVATTTGPTSSDALVAWNAWGEQNTDATGGACLNDGGRIAITHDYVNWTVLFAAPTGTQPPFCPRGPPQATYDPKTNQYVVYWDDANYPYVTYDTNGSIIYVGDSDLAQDEMLSAHTAAIECGNTTAVDNCLVAWDALNAYGCLTFRHTHVLPTGQLAAGTAYTQCYRQERTPAISYREAGGSYRWGLVLKQDYALWAMRKDMASTNWVNPSLVLWDSLNGLMSPALSQRWELFLGFILVPVDFMYTVSLP